MLLPDRPLLLPDEYRAAVAAFAAVRRDEVQVRGWQARIGTPVDGDPGPATRAALALLAPPETAPQALTIVSRAEWGARPYSGRRQPLGTVRRIVIHHTATGALPTTRAEGAECTHRIQGMHMGQGWADVGYHLLLAQDGTWYQGRDQFDRSQPLTQGLAQGSHVKHFNEGSIGLSVIGYFHAPKEHRMSPAAEEALRAMVGRLRDEYGPVPVVAHRDIAPTACPGDRLYPLVKSLTP